MKTLQQTLMDRDGLTAQEARTLILQAEGRALGGDDPEEVLQEEFGLEPDCVIDLINGVTATLGGVS